MRPGARGRMARDAAMAAWRRRGYSARWIAWRFGVSEAEVERALARESLSMSPERGRRP